MTGDSSSTIETRSSTRREGIRNRGRGKSSQDNNDKDEENHHLRISHRRSSRGRNDDDQDFDETRSSSSSSSRRRRRKEKKKRKSYRDDDAPERRQLTDVSDSVHQSDEDKDAVLSRHRLFRDANETPMFNNSSAFHRQLPSSASSLQQQQQQQKQQQKQQQQEHHQEDQQRRRRRLEGSGAEEDEAAMRRLLHNDVRALMKIFPEVCVCVRVGYMCRGRYFSPHIVQATSKYMNQICTTFFVVYFKNVVRSLEPLLCFVVSTFFQSICFACIFFLF